MSHDPSFSETSRTGLSTSPRAEGRPSVRATSPRARGNGRGATDANAAFVAFSFRSNARDGPASDHATAATRGEADENLARFVIARARDDGR